VSMQIIARIDGNVQWKYFRSTEGHWIAISDALKLTLQADTYGELMEDITSTLDAVFRDLLLSSELDKFLEEHGWTLTQQIVGPIQNVRFDVPFAVVAAANDRERHLHQ